MSPFVSKADEPLPMPLPSLPSPLPTHKTHPWIIEHSWGQGFAVQHPPPPLQVLEMSLDNRTGWVKVGCLSNPQSPVYHSQHSIPICTSHIPLVLSSGILRISLSHTSSLLGCHGTPTLTLTLP